MTEQRELVRLLRQRYQDMGDTLTRKAADEIEGLVQWVCFIYNLRGYQLTDEVWVLFKEFCETRGLTNEVKFEKLPRE